MVIDDQDAHSFPQLIQQRLHRAQLEMAAEPQNQDMLAGLQMAVEYSESCRETTSAHPRATDFRT